MEKGFWCVIQRRKEFANPRVSVTDNLDLLDGQEYLGIITVALVENSVRRAVKCGYVIRHTAGKSIATKLVIQGSDGLFGRRRMKDGPHSRLAVARLG